MRIQFPNTVMPRFTTHFGRNEKNARYIGETVNRVIVDINLHMRLVFGGKESGTVNRGNTVNRGSVNRGTIGPFLDI